ncbi:MAG: hypothetical protein J6B10_00850 [Lachnospiraceae bacterium]|nr:hypothetical protein [Lachnospiraceae bacterium]
MGTIPTERKLELIRRMRNESQNNRIKMSGRERILYNGSDYVDGACDLPGHEKATDLPDYTVSGTWKFRVFAAVLLFAAFVAWDNGYYPMLPENTGQLYHIIGEDMFSSNLFAFMADFPYTLEMNE